MVVAFPHAPPTLKTERLILRPFRPEDAESVNSLLQDPAVSSTTLNVPHPYDLEMADKWIASQYGEFERGEGVRFAVCLEEGSLIGAIGIHLTLRHHRGEVGYWIGKDFWNHGYCTEALQRLIEFAFSELNLHKVTSHHMLENPASGRVMQKAGMKKEGTLIDQVVKGPVIHSVDLYGVINPAHG